YVKAIRYYAEGMEHLGKDDLNQAHAALDSLRDMAKNENLKDITIWEINSVYDLVQIAEKVLQAEIFAKEESYEPSMALLQEAVALEDALNYNEPPDWFFSVRHALGAVQMNAKKYQDAILTYEEDLKRLPKNGW